jgi:hypothetical protein
VDGSKEFNSTYYNVSSFLEEFALIIGFLASEPNEPLYLFCLSVQEFLFSGKFSLNIKSENISM